MHKKTLVFITIIAITLFLSFVTVLAKGEQWFDKGKPSEAISLQDKSTLVTQKNITKWQSNTYWKEGNCYYFDLELDSPKTGQIETAYSFDELTNTTTEINKTIGPAWQDARRELSCGRLLSDSEIQDLELKNIQWTLQQLAATDTPTQIVKTQSLKGENILQGTTIG